MQYFYYFLFYPLYQVFIFAQHIDHFIWKVFLNHQILMNLRVIVIVQIYLLNLEMLFNYTIVNYQNHLEQILFHFTIQTNILIIQTYKSERVFIVLFYFYKKKLIHKVNRFSEFALTFSNHKVVQLLRKIIIIQQHLLYQELLFKSLTQIKTILHGMLVDIMNLIHMDNILANIQLLMLFMTQHIKERN